MIHVDKNTGLIQGIYQALQMSVSWERVSEIQSIKDTKHRVATWLNRPAMVTNWKMRRRRWILRLMAAVIMRLVVVHSASKYNVVKATDTMSATAGKTHRAHLQHLHFFIQLFVPSIAHSLTSQLFACLIAHSLTHSFYHHAFSHWFI